MATHLQPDFDDVLQTAEGGNTPLILLMGPQKSGKTSIVRVLFAKMSPHDTSFLEPTTTPQGIIYPAPSFPTQQSSSPNLAQQVTAPPQKCPSESEALLKCRIIDLPGSPTFMKQQSALLERLLQASASIVFVIDASSDQTWPEATQSLISLLSTMESNDMIKPVSVFLHKTDSENFSGELRAQYTDLRRTLLDSLRSASIRLPVTFFVTSLYDISLYESFSRLMMQLIPKTNLLGTLLDGFISACGVEKAYVVDTNSKLYVGADSTTPDVSLFNLLCDTIDLVFDIGFVYSPNQDYDDEDDNIDLNGQYGQNGSNANSLRSLNELQSLQNPPISHSQQSGSGLNPSTASNNGNVSSKPGNEGVDDADFDCYSAEVSLFNGSKLYLRQINNYLTLMFTMRTDSQNSGHQIGTKHSKGILEHNVMCFKQALGEIFDINCYGIPQRNQRGNLGANGFAGNNGEYGVQQYMGSYASQSAIANLKQYYGTVGSSMPAKSYMASNNGNSFMAPSSFVQGNGGKMMGGQSMMNGGIAGSSRTATFNNFNHTMDQNQASGSMPSYNHSSRQ